MSDPVEKSPQTPVAPQAAPKTAPEATKPPEGTPAPTESKAAVAAQAVEARASVAAAPKEEDPVEKATTFDAARDAASALYVNKMLGGNFRFENQTLQADAGKAIQQLIENIRGITSGLPMQKKWMSEVVNKLTADSILATKNQVLDKAGFDKALQNTSLRYYTNLGHWLEFNLKSENAAEITPPPPEASKPPEQPAEVTPPVAPAPPAAPPAETEEPDDPEDASSLDQFRTFVKDLGDDSKFKGPLTRLLEKLSQFAVSLCGMKYIGDYFRGSLISNEELSAKGDVVAKKMVIVERHFKKFGLTRKMANELGKAPAAEFVAKVKKSPEQIDESDREKIQILSNQVDIYIKGHPGLDKKAKISEIMSAADFKPKYNNAPDTPSEQPTPPTATPPKAPPVGNV